MNIKMLKSALAGLVLSVSGFANAGLIAIDDWHLTTDNFGGLKTSWNSVDVAFAVSKSTFFDSTATYEAIDGWHFATYAEYATLTNIEQTGGTSSSVYHNLGGWNGYDWEGKTRYIFKFADSNFDNQYMFHAGGYEDSNWMSGNKWSQTHYTQTNLDNNFAGFVMIKGNAAQVPEPSTLAIFALGIMGLASRRFKKQS